MRYVCWLLLRAPTDFSRKFPLQPAVVQFGAGMKLFASVTFATREKRAAGIIEANPLPPGNGSPVVGSLRTVWKFPASSSEVGTFAKPAFPPVDCRNPSDR